MEKKGFLASWLMLISSRKDIIFGVTWTTALANIIAGNGFPVITKSIVSIIAMAMLTLSVYIYNDIIDRQMDAYSNKEKKMGRPLAHGKVSVKNAKILVIISAAAGILSCAYLGTNVLTIGVIYFILFYLYSYPKVRFKTIYIMKNVITALILPIAFLIGGTSIIGVINLHILFLSLAYFVFMFLILPAGADWLDYEEDKAFNIKTIGNTFSWGQNIILFNIGVLIMILSTFVHYVFWGSNYLPLILVTGLGVLVMVYSNKLAKENGIVASYKLRPVGYVYLLLTPLFYALGVLF